MCAIFIWQQSNRKLHTRTQFSHISQDENQWNSTILLQCMRVCVQINGNRFKCTDCRSDIKLIDPFQRYSFSVQVLHVKIRDWHLTIFDFNFKFGWFSRVVAANARGKLLKRITLQLSRLLSRNYLRNSAKRFVN